MLVRAFGTGPAAGLQDNLAVEDPAAFTAAVFKEALRGRGITVAGGATSAHRYSHAKPASLPPNVRRPSSLL